MLPAFVSRFELGEAGLAAGTERLRELIEKIAADPIASRNANWALGADARDRFGIATMTHHYESMYRDDVGATSTAQNDTVSLGLSERVALSARN
jgi:hypothetical protein